MSIHSRDLLCKFPGSASNNTTFCTRFCVRHVVCYREGPIPPDLGALTKLEQIDLSANQLDGEP